MADTYQINPLRPYYIPPSIGKETQPILQPTTAASTSSFSFPDLDYTEYIPEASPSVTGQIRTFLDKGLWKYTSVVAAQPFEVAKLILQTRVAQESDLDEPTQHRGASYERDDYTEEEYEDEEDEEPNYFASSAPIEQPTSRSPVRGRRGRPSREDLLRKEQQSSPYLLMKRPHSLIDALTALQGKDGSLAIWRGTNSTFLYSVLLRTLETFFRSFFGALLGVVENDINITAASSIADSTILAATFPAATIAIATVASALSALILAPIDAARTRLILTAGDQEPRSLLSTIRTLPRAYLIPTHLFPTTYVHPLAYFRC